MAVVVAGLVYCSFVVVHGLRGGGGQEVAELLLDNLASHHPVLLPRLPTSPGKLRLGSPGAQIRYHGDAAASGSYRPLLQGAAGSLGLSFTYRTQADSTTARSTLDQVARRAALTGDECGGKDRMAGASCWSKAAGSAVLLDGLRLRKP